MENCKKLILVPQTLGLRNLWNIGLSAELEMLLVFVSGAVPSCSANELLGKMPPIPYHTCPPRRGTHNYSHNYSLSFDVPSGIGCPPHVALQLLQCRGFPVQGHLPVHVVHDSLDDTLQLLLPAAALQRDRHSPVQAGVLLSLQSAVRAWC